MKTVVIYKSKTGFSRKFAEWIGKELSADIFDISKVTTTNMLAAYDTVIYGGGLYSGGINGVKYITQNLDKLKDKKIIVFATGMSPAREAAIIEVRNKNLTFEEQKHIQFFYLRGGFDYSKLKPFDKMLMTLLKWKIKIKKELTPDEIGMQVSFRKPVDFTIKKSIDKIINYVNLLENN